MIRRVVVGGVVVGLAFWAWVFSPLWLLAALVLSPLVPGRWRLPRIAWIALMSGHFRLSATPEQAEERRAALFLCRELDERIAATRRTAAREKQVARQVAINLELKALLAERERVAQGL